MIVGFSFNKIVAEKSTAVRGKVNINNNVSITGVEDANVNVAQGRKGVKIKFTFESQYNPNIGLLRLEGELVLLEETKAATEMIKRWQKEKAVPQPMVTPVLNHILDRSNMEALFLARDLNLPSPIRLPRATINPPKKK